MAEFHQQSTRLKIFEDPHRLVSLFSSHFENFLIESAILIACDERAEIEVEVHRDMSKFAQLRRLEVD